MSRCAICKKPIGTAARATSRSGKVCHEACLKQAKAAGAGGAGSGSSASRQPLASRRDRPDESPKKPSRPRLQTPTLAQILRVSCPACQASPGTTCTLRGGHQARAEAYRAVAGMVPTGPLGISLSGAAPRARRDGPP
ncbi:zinc finger domain-containing protein [Streptomyces sp. NPDC001414]